MGFPDWSLILNQLVALSIVLAPVEIFLLLNIIRIRLTIARWLVNWSDSDFRTNFFKEAAHGVLRALKERAGSARGVEARQEQAQLLQSAEQGDLDINQLILSQVKGDINVLGFKIPKAVAAQFLMQQLPKFLGGAGSQGSSSSSSRGNQQWDV